MALVTRISRLFTADAHALLDRLEAPDVLLRQALREMQEALETNQRRSQSMSLGIESVTRELAGMTTDITACDEELDLCLTENSIADNTDHLARSVVRRKLTLAAEHKRLTAHQQTLISQHNVLLGQIEDQHQSLQAMQQKAALLIRETPGPALNEHSISDEQIDIALLAEKDARSER